MSDEANQLFQSLWPDLLQAIGRANNFTGSYFLKSHPVSFSGNAFVIGFDPEFTEGFGLMNNEKTRKLIRALLSELGYPEVQVEIIQSVRPDHFPPPGLFPSQLRRGIERESQPKFNSLKSQRDYARTTSKSTAVLKRFPKITGHMGGFIFGLIPYFDKIGSLYVLENSGMEGCLKIGKTVKPAEIRAAEVTKEFEAVHPFRVSFVQRFRNYSLAEDYVHTCLVQHRTSYIKSVDNSLNIWGQAATRTHTSSEVFKCTLEQAKDCILAIEGGNEHVHAFETEYLLNSTKRLSEFAQIYGDATDIIVPWESANRTMRERLKRGECSVKTITQEKEGEQLKLL